MILLSIDPGLRACGCALWRDRELVAADWVRGHHGGEFSAQRAEAMARAIDEWLGDIDCPPTIHQAVIEMPRTYGGRSRRGDANDLINLAALVGYLSAWFATQGTTPCWLPPVVMPKDVTENRVRALLSSEELLHVAKRNDHVWDALGIGARWLRR
jgi:hypothetical protein